MRYNIRKLAYKRLEQEMDIDSMSVSEFKLNWQRIWERWIDLMVIARNKILIIKNMKLLNSKKKLLTR